MDPAPLYDCYIFVTESQLFMHLALGYAFSLPTICETNQCQILSSPYCQILMDSVLCNNYVPFHKNSAQAAANLFDGSPDMIGDPTTGLGKCRERATIEIL